MSSCEAAVWFTVCVCVCVLCSLPGWVLLSECHNDFGHTIQCVCSMASLSHVCSLPCRHLLHWRRIDRVHWFSAALGLPRCVAACVQGYYCLAGATNYSTYRRPLSNRFAYCMDSLHSRQLLPDIVGVCHTSFTHPLDVIFVQHAKPAPTTTALCKLAMRRVSVSLACQIRQRCAFSVLLWLLLPAWFNFANTERRASATFDPHCVDQLAPPALMVLSLAAARAQVCACSL